MAVADGPFAVKFISRRATRVKTLFWEAIQMRSLTQAAASLLTATCLSSLSLADDANPTGTWKWSANINNETREFTLKLKLEGDKLTGSMLGRDNQETAIENASYKDGEVAFSVTRERNNQKRTVKYKGKVSGDTIKGKSSVERDGQTIDRDWEAKREKA
ncbi:MAG TPA: hypothetical protein VG125_25990 [Pirellulales bacterium]|jgi:hypothetical protein|nr:hypothetical protein [Pirellulales bacterium]